MPIKSTAGLITDIQEIIYMLDLHQCCNVQQKDIYFPKLTDVQIFPQTHTVMFVW